MHRPSVLAVSLAAGACVALAAGAASAAPFGIDVTTGGTMPVARMKVVMTGGYAAGVAVDINGTSAALPMGTDKAFFSGPGLDSGFVTHVGTTLVIDLNLFSVVTSGTNRCSASVGAGTKTYTVNVTAGGATSAIGLAGYSATSEVNCGCANRRKATGIAWQGGAAPFTEQRIPLDVMMVLDESGSMLSAPGGGAGSSKWKITTEAVDELIATLNLESTTNDRLGAIFFDDQRKLLMNGTTAYFPKSPAPGFGPISTEMNDAAKHPRSGSTSIGGALKPALEQSVCVLNNDPIADPYILLMSDGAQNTAPNVDDGAGADTGSKVLSYSATCPAGGATLQRLTVGCVPVLTVYVDLPPASAAASLLQAISDQTAGTSASRAQLSTDPPAAFGGTLVSMLKGSTMSFASKTTTTLAAGASSSAAIPVSIDGTVKRVIVLLGWMPQAGNENALLFQATAPGTTPGTTAMTAMSRVSAAATGGNVGRGPYFIAAAADLTPANVGNWSFTVSRSPNSENRNGAIPYHLYVFAVESKLEFIPRFAGGRHGTGEPLVLNLDLGIDRKAVAGGGNSVKVTVDGPSGAIGTLLHDFNDPGGAGTTGETESPADKKLNNLNKDPNLAGQTVPKPTGESLAFVDKGGGHYEVVLNQPRLPGGYVFHLTIDLNGPAGPIHRVEDLDTMVEVAPDPARSVIQVSANNGGTGAVTIAPIDRFGNYMGPGFESSVRVKVVGGPGVAATAIDPKVDGTYTVQLTGLTPGTDPEVVVEVAGKPVVQGPLSKLPTVACRKQGGGCASCGGGGGPGGVCVPAAGLILLGVRRRRRRRADGRLDNREERVPPA